MIFESTGTVLAVYYSAQPVLLCKCVKKVHVYNSFPIKFANAQQGASRRKSSLSTNAGDNLFRFASIISPAALKSLSTAVDVAGGVRYLVKRDWIKGKDNSSHIHLFAKATRALPAGPFAR